MLFHKFYYQVVIWVMFEEAYFLDPCCTGTFFIFHKRSSAALYYFFNKSNLVISVHNRKWQKFMGFYIYWECSPCWYLCRASSTTENSLCCWKGSLKSHCSSLLFLFDFYWSVYWEIVCLWLVCAAIFRYKPRNYEVLGFRV